MKDRSASTFIRQQFDNELRALPKRDYDTLLRLFEDAARRYHDVPSPGTRSRPAIREALTPVIRLVGALVGASEQFVTRLQDAQQIFAKDAEVAETFSRERQAHEAFHSSTQSWLKRALAGVQEKRGRKHGDPEKRLRFCAWIGKQLTGVGLRLSTRPADTWGQIYALMCWAAHVPIDHENHDSGRDLRKALAYLYQWPKAPDSLTDDFVLTEGPRKRVGKTWALRPRTGGKRVLTAELRAG